MSSDRFTGRRALVTGAGGGIGRATVRRLVGEGARVVAVDRDEDALRETCAGLAGASYRALDVRSDEVLGAIRDLDPHILVNGAGILRRHAILDHPLDDWQMTLDVNLKAMFRLSREFAARKVADGGGGVIVNVASVEGFTAAPAHVAYTVSKSGVVMLTKAFALELAAYGVRCVAIAPGVTETGMNVDLRRDPVRSARLKEPIPMGRFGLPDEQAAAIAFLASDDASYITGVVLPIDGGWLAA